MIGSSTIEKALESSLQQDLDTRILLCRKNIAAVEKRDLKGTHRVCQMFRRVLASCTEDPHATSEQIQAVSELYGRVRAFDPRRNPKGHEEPDDLDSVAEHRERVKPKPPAPPVPDGYQAGFINVNEILDRVAVKYKQQPPWTDLANEQLLQVALGEGVPLTEHSVRQLYLSFAYDFMGRLKGIDGSLAPQAKWVTASICAVAKKHGISIPAPNCFTNPLDELCFRV